jgi:hypothetical protein
MATDSDSVRLSQWPVFRQTSLSARVHRVTSNLLNIAQRRIIESEHSINIYDIAIYYRPTYHDRVNLYMYKLATSPPFAITQSRVARGRFVTSVLLRCPSTIVSLHVLSRTRQRAERNFRISGYIINNRRTREFRCASSHAGHPRAFVCVQKKLCKL